DTVTGLPTITHLMQSGANPTELARLCHRTRSGCLVMGASRLASVLFDIEKSPGSNEKSPNAEELEDAAKETIAALREYLDIQGK
ncbi:MAG TPA: hypothetical protein PKA91_18255, partial [Leptospiraceae bacterium]|nr:hypothetical protein [Leptospiraceae bacterium]